MLLLFILTADLAYAQISAPGSRPLLIGLAWVYQPGLQQLGGELEAGVMFRQPDGTGWLLATTGGIRQMNQPNQVVFEQNQITPIGPSNGSGEFKSEWESFLGLNVGYLFANNIGVVISPSIIHFEAKQADKFGENIFVHTRTRHVYLGTIGAELRASVDPTLQLRFGYSSRLGIRSGVSAVLDIIPDSAIQYGDSIAPLYLTTGFDLLNGIGLGYARGSDGNSTVNALLAYHPTRKDFSFSNVLAFNLGEMILKGSYVSMMTSLAFNFSEYRSSPFTLSLNLGWRSFGKFFYDVHAGAGYQTPRREAGLSEFKPVVSAGVAIGIRASDIF